jgi:hypothetical protein
MRLKIVYPLAAALVLTGCGGDGAGSDNSAADANHVSEDPYGATGAPGADLTDNGATDGANGLADTPDAGNSGDANLADVPDNGA